MQEKRLRILFVDDDGNILSGLRRSLHGMAASWDMTFCDGGEKALAALEQHFFDVVVSDMRMPGMDGADLLTRVQKQYPDTIRVILSGYADQNSVMRTVGPAHVYLAKPCTAGATQGSDRPSLPWPCALCCPTPICGGHYREYRHCQAPRKPFWRWRRKSAPPVPRRHRLPPSSAGTWP